MGLSPKIAGSIPAVIIPRRHNCKRGRLEVTAVLAVRAASIPKTTRVLGIICVASGGFFRHTSVSVAQLGEHLTFNQDVTGSSPAGNIVKKKEKGGKQNGRTVKGIPGGIKHIGCSRDSQSVSQ